MKLKCNLLKLYALHLIATVTSTYDTVGAFLESFSGSVYLCFTFIHFVLIFLVSYNNFSLLGKSLKSDGAWFYMFGQFPTEAKKFFPVSNNGFDSPVSFEIFIAI